MTGYGIRRVVEGWIAQTAYESCKYAQWVEVEHLDDQVPSGRFKVRVGVPSRITGEDVCQDIELPDGFDVGLSENYPVAKDGVVSFETFHYQLGGQWSDSEGPFRVE